MRLLYCLWLVLNGGVSAILSLVGHIQLTEVPPQEQLETISSSRLMKGTFLLSFKGVTSQSASSSKVLALNPSRLVSSTGQQAD